MIITYACDFPAAESCISRKKSFACKRSAKLCPSRFSSIAKRFALHVEIRQFLLYRFNFLFVLLESTEQSGKYSRFYMQNTPCSGLTRQRNR